MGRVNSPEAVPSAMEFEALFERARDHEVTEATVREALARRRGDGADGGR
jgi:hypothetical protein